MIAEAKKYRTYARECMRQANAEPLLGRRERLLELARVWMQAARREQQLYPAELVEAPEQQSQRAA